MEGSRREMELILSGSRGRQLRRDDDDDDDARSVMTAMDDDEAEERVRNRRRMEREESEIAKQNTELTQQVESLSTEVSEAVQLSRTLQSRHDEAMAAVRLLTERVGALESGIASRIADAVLETDKKWESWKSSAENGWKREKESWEAERERLRGVVRDWEEASRRAQEEERDRELNEQLSESSDEEQPRKANGRPRKPKRRRPSTKTALAVRALRELADEGSSTPKQLEPPAVTGLPKRRSGKAGSVASDEKDTSESGRDSGDTLRDKDMIKARDKSRGKQ